jgi:hypothetical protein
MRLKLIACEILFRELSYFAAKSPHRIDATFLAKGLHDVGRQKMFQELDKVLDAVEPSEYDAVLLGYALCNGGIAGLSPRGKAPLVVPRAHDCITLFLGDKNKYEEYFFSHPGVYFKTVGWLERGDHLVQNYLHPPDINDDSPCIYDPRTEQYITFRQMVKKYGETNARYIWEQLVATPHYQQITFIETGIEPNEQFLQQAKREAAERNWIFETIRGDLRLLQNLVNGNWNEEDFLIVQPGQKIDFDYSGQIVKNIHTTK